MTIWILALVLLLCLAGLGYKQGAIRVGFSLVGLLMAAMLAMPLGRALFPLMAKIGIKNPALAGFIAPIIVFVVILAIFKAAGLAVHRKVDVYYKYSAGDLRAILWERLNRRLGVCLGLANATVYLLLICVLALTMSYWTVQMGGDNSSFAVKTLNRLGKDLVSSGFAKAVHAVDPATVNYYKAADVAGIIYHNPLIDARLSRYPGFLAIGEKPELQELANNTDFTEMRQQQAPLAEFMAHAKIKPILENPTLIHEIWATTKTNLNDLHHYLVSSTSESPKYDPERILGRWVVDINAWVNAMKQADTRLNPRQLNAIRQQLSATLGDTVLVAAPGGEIFFKNAPTFAPGSLKPTQENIQGKWEKTSDEKYTISFTKDGTNQILEASIVGEKLAIETGIGMKLFFVRED